METQKQTSATPPTPPLETRLDVLYTEIRDVILSRQNPVTGLLPASTAVTAHGDYTDAWVRDNVYSILAVWGLGLAYSKVDADQGRTMELEGSVIKLMRGLLFAMMRQADKVEKFKTTQLPGDALHAKYSIHTGGTVVGDYEWGHLQLDATSLFLLMLGQMTASGLNIVLTVDEVNFVQNLVYYVGRTYQTPDFGIWERGNKINSGNPELNASSIGMAKAALEALNGLDLFGVRGSQATVIHAFPDEIARARITLESLLPWESSSKEVDSALLSIVGYPAFAVDDKELADATRQRILDRLQGRYGCKRFLRDGHQTVLEDSRRLHYEPGELQKFEDIESEWPLFYTYLLLDCLFRKDEAGAADYYQRLQGLFEEVNGVRLLPELYFVPADKVELEKATPQSQERQANENVPLVWAQSLYYLGHMLKDGLLHLGDIDPLGRHHRIGNERRPVIQMALLSEDAELQAELETVGIKTEVPAQLTPLQVRYPAELATAYHQIGRNDKLGLTGRPIRRLRSLTTSKVFRIRGELMLFLPSFSDQHGFYLTLDEEMYVAQLHSELAYINKHWCQLGRPTMTLLITRAMWDTGRDAIAGLVAELKDGHCGEVQVRVGPVHELLAVAGRERMDNLHDFRFSEHPMAPEAAFTYHLHTEVEGNVPLSASVELEMESSANMPELLEKLRNSHNLFEQTEILQNLAIRLGLSFETGWGAGGEAVTVGQLLEEVYRVAARGDAANRPYWSIVRRTAGLTGKIDLTLADAVTDILVRQRQITVGKAFFEDARISRPLQPHEIQAKIHRFARDDVREQVMTQEILIYLGLLIRTEPQLFSGLFTLRTGHLILLLTTELAEELDLRQEEAYEELMCSSPSRVQSLLRLVLEGHGTVSDLLQQQESLTAEKGCLTNLGPAGADIAEEAPPPGGWLNQRVKLGTLNRLPKTFFPDVWKLLHHCQGIVIGEKFERRNRLESAYVLSEMTPGEQTFALQLEHLLSKIEFPEYRQLNVEAIEKLAEIAALNPTLRIEGFITLDVLIGHAVRLAYLESCPDRAHRYDEDKPAAWRAFYESSPRACAHSYAMALQYLVEAGDAG